MKKLSILLAVFTCMPIGLSAEQPSFNNLRSLGDLSVQNRIQRAVLEQSFQNDKTFLAQQAVKQVIEKNNPPTLLWEDFLAAEENLSRRRQAFETQAIQQLRKEAKFSALTFHFDAPDYKELLADKKIIYIGEHHYSKAVPAEMINILRSIRQHNPGKRILLASEFGFRQKNLPYALQRAKAQAPFSNKYPQIEQAANELNIDQLALDDYLTQVYSYDSEDKMVMYDDLQVPVRFTPLLAYTHGWIASVKVGSVFVSLPNFIPDPFSAQGQQEIFQRSVELQQSLFGTTQRNAQWASYIQAAAPFYDLIIVHAGLGHLTPDNMLNLPSMLGDGNPFVISLTPFGKEYNKKIAELSSQVGFQPPAPQVSPLASELGNTLDKYLAAPQGAQEKPYWSRGNLAFTDPNTSQTVTADILWYFLPEPALQ